MVPRDRIPRRKELSIIAKFHLNLAECNSRPDLTCSSRWRITSRESLKAAVREPRERENLTEIVNLTLLARLTRESVLAMLSLLFFLTGSTKIHKGLIHTEIRIPDCTRLRHPKPFTRKRAGNRWIESAISQLMHCPRLFSDRCKCIQYITPAQ